MRPSTPALRGGGKSSTSWLARQFSDPYVRQRMADPAHYRSRSAFKLLEIEARFRFLDRLLRRTGKTTTGSTTPRQPVIVDLGAAPGGWSQVVAAKCGCPLHRPLEDGAERDTMHLYGLTPAAQLARHGSWSTRTREPASSPPPPPDPAAPDPAALDPDPPARPTIIALDRLRMPPLPGVHTVQADLLAAPAAATALVRALLPPGTPPAAPAGAVVDLLLSDLAANATGCATADAAAALRICTAVLAFAERHLRVRAPPHEPGGTLLLKHFVHPDMTQFYNDVLRPSFTRVERVKPPSSRADSAECYWLCFGWRRTPEDRRQQSSALPIEFQPQLPI